METRGARQGGRRSIRMEDYDYASAGAYFITICSQNRGFVFGNVINDAVELTALGQIVLDAWLRLQERFPSIVLDTFMIMPNHLHALILMRESAGAGFPRPLTHAQGASRPLQEGAETAPLQRSTLGQVIAYFKYQTTKSVNSTNGTPGLRLWQRNYYEHVIRNEDELRTAREYILTNPLRWAIDHENPESGRHK